MTIVYIAIGSNLGDRRRNIEQAIDLLGDTNGIEVTQVSALYETDPVAGPRQGKFLNGAIEIKTDLSPYELLKELHRIEDELGRKRTILNGPRTIDLDILLYGDLTIDEPDLKIPHRRMWQREFVLKPLAEIAPEIVSRCK